MEFCECGSLKVNGKCSNKRCKHGKRLEGLRATEKQLAYIEKLCGQLGLNEDDIKPNMTKLEASKLIDELHDKLDYGEEL